MKKLLYISDMLNSGYGTVSNTIIKELLRSKLFDIYLIPINTSNNEKFLKNKLSIDFLINQDKINPINYFDLTKCVQDKVSDFSNSVLHNGLRLISESLVLLAILVLLAFTNFKLFIFFASFFMLLKEQGTFFIWL